MSKRKICVVTGSRAEYGLLYWLMKLIQDDADLSLQIIATGTHLSPEFGMTYQIIENDGFEIDEKVDIQISEDTPVGIAKSMGLGLTGCAEALHRLQPDVIVLLGDRYEILAAAEAALLARIPVAHIHGGELTEGNFDESIRHAITKMAHIHFVASEPYRRRVIQLGENPDRVYNFGAPGLDYIRRANLLSRAELEGQLQFNLGEQFFLVTYHPVTLEKAGPQTAMQALLDALDTFQSYQILFTLPNADTDNRIITAMIHDYCGLNLDRAAAFTSLGQIRYLSAMKYCAAVIGNSSSGIIEAPAMKTATVNIGDRQRGRLTADSIISCAEDSKAIAEAISAAVSLTFRERVRKTVSLFGQGNASEEMVRVLKTIELSGIQIKTFCDL